MRLQRQLCGTVLIMEAVVIGLAIPVAIVVEHLRHGVAGGVGGALAVCAVLLSAVVGRPGQGWALWAGTALQVLVIASGIVVPAMYVLGVIFTALWVTGIWLARRLQTPAVSPAQSDPPETEPAAPGSRGSLGGAPVPWAVGTEIVGKLRLGANHHHPAPDSPRAGDRDRIPGTGWVSATVVQVRPLGRHRRRPQPPTLTAPDRSPDRKVPVPDEQRADVPRP